MRAIIVAASLCVPMLGTCFAQTSTAAMSRIETRIPPQALGSALKQLAGIRRIQILFLTADVKDLRTPGASGKLTADETLNRLLKGTGLKYRYVDKNAISILRSPVTEPATQTPSIDLKSSHRPQPLRDPKTASAIIGTVDPADVPRPRKKSHASKQQAVRLQEVIVTGTHIAGAAPISPVTIITSDDIKTSGLPDIGSVIRAQPQFFSGGDNPNAIAGGGLNGGSSFINVSSANLRGIGAGETLTLLDGQRMPDVAGLGYVDLSMIPSIAVQRIEIETGGASAIYGGDAVAGVINIILRKNYSGEHTDAYVGTTVDGGFTQQYSQLVGKTWNGGADGVMLGYQFHSEDEILASQREISQLAGTGTSLQPQTRDNSAFLTAQYKVTANVTGHLEGVYRHGTNSLEWYGQGEQGRQDEGTLDGGLVYQAEGGRTVGVDVTYAGDSDSLVTTYEGTYQKAAEQSRLYAVSLTGQGKLFSLPGGQTIQAAVGAGARSEHFDNEAITPAGPSTLGSRKAEHAYAELHVPLFPADPRRIGLERLTFAAAGRFEHYSDFGSITEPKIELAWSPIQEVRISATWGRSFEPPSLNQLYGGAYAILYPGSFFKLKPGSEVLYLEGSNPKLTAQTSTTRTVTVEWKPSMRTMRGVTATLSYFDIDFDNRVRAPILNFVQAVSNPIYAPFVVRQPSTALQNAAIASVPASNFFNFVGPGANPADVQALVYGNLQNVSLEAIHGVDATVSYERPTSYGDLAVNASGSWEAFDQQELPGAGLLQVAGTIFNPPKFKSRVMVAWQHSSWGINLFGNHISGELDTSATPTAHVASWTTVDGQLWYAIAGITIRLSSQNILNKAPPAVAASSTSPPGLGFDPDNYSALGRIMSLDASVDW